LDFVVLFISCGDRFREAFLLSSAKKTFAVKTGDVVVEGKVIGYLKKH